MVSDEAIGIDVAEVGKAGAGGHRDEVVVKNVRSCIVVEVPGRSLAVVERHAIERPRDRDGLHLGRDPDAQKNDKKASGDSIAHGSFLLSQRPIL